MTKMKSKKMSKSTFAVIIMAIAMVAMLAFGGTYAYFTASAKADSATFTTGHVKLTANGKLATVDATTVMPNQEILAANAIQLTVNTSESAGNFVAIKFTITAKDADDQDITDLGTKLSINVATLLGNAWSATSVNDVYIYGTEADPTEVTSTVNVNAAALTFDATDNWAQGSDGNLEASSQYKLMGAKITITMQAYSIQSTGTVSELVTALLAKF